MAVYALRTLLASTNKTLHCWEKLRTVHQQCRGKILGVAPPAAALTVATRTTQQRGVKHHEFPHAKVTNVVRNVAATASRGHP
jgi:hypothetical protein